MLGPSAQKTPRKRRFFASSTMSAWMLSSTCYHIRLRNPPISVSDKGTTPLPNAGAGANVVVWLFPFLLSDRPF
jgi:hypothetical protein